MEPKYYKAEYVYCRVLDEDSPLWYFEISHSFMGPREWQEAVISWKQYKKRLDGVGESYKEVSQLEVLVVCGST